MSLFYDGYDIISYGEKVGQLKKRKKPIQRIQLENYVGAIVLPEDSDIIDYSVLTNKKLEDKQRYRIVFDACRFDKTTFNKC